MASIENTSSPTPARFETAREELEYYKAQYEHLEGELQEFQASSRELEAELEKDIEASEKRERSLKERLEALQYEVEEWKTRCKQSKVEANHAQNTLQKEITALRDTNRNLQLKLRDIEVANDDYERQARNTSSSMEDLESKYNVSLERGVILEEEIKASELERESLRIEVQRIRDELSDFKVEAEITQEKLRSLESGTRRRLNRTSQASDSKLQQQPKSPSSERSLASISTRGISTPPPTKSEASGTASDALTPPSPPLSETFAPTKLVDSASSLVKDRTKLSDADVTPRPGHQAMGKARHIRAPSSLQPNTTTPTPNFARRTAGVASRPRGAATENLPRSGSLYQIRGLIGKMQKLEERVQSARSKLPAPTSTPPRASPRSASGVAADVLSNVTVRSNKKRLTSNSSDTPEPLTPSAHVEVGGKRLMHRHSRISMSGQSIDGTSSRPTSRASAISYGAPQFGRPSSRASYIGRPATGIEQQPQSQGPKEDSRRPRSSLSGRATPSHAHRQSISGSLAEESDASARSFATPTARRTTLDKNGMGSVIPAPSSALRRQSSRMGPPDRTLPHQKQQEPLQHDVGETF